MTKIQWTEATWNPTTGCDRVSPGCDHCYALTMAARLKGMGQAKYQRDGSSMTSGPGFGVSIHPDELTAPLRWRKPRMVFVDSMGDILHDQVPIEFLAKTWATMAATPQHTYQVLTKRHARMRSVLNSLAFYAEMWAECVELIGKDTARALWDGRPDVPWPLPNVWLGVSVEDQKRAELRIPALYETPATVRFLSCEPLLTAVDLSPWFGPVDHPDCWDDHPSYAECPRCIQSEWVIVGGESGPGARPMDLDWVRSIRDQCQAAGVPLFVKQLGSVWARNGYGPNGPDSKGGDPHYWPEDLRIREYPK